MRGVKFGGLLRAQLHRSVNVTLDQLGGLSLYADPGHFGGQPVVHQPLAGLGRTLLAFI